MTDHQNVQYHNIQNENQFVIPPNERTRTIESDESIATT